jgi:hypothetical protein
MLAIGCCDWHSVQYAKSHPWPREKKGKTVSMSHRLVAGGPVVCELCLQPESREKKLCLVSTQPCSGHFLKKDYRIRQ